MNKARERKKSRRLAYLAGLLLVAGTSVYGQDATPQNFIQIARFKGEDYTIDYEKFSVYTDECEFFENSGTNLGAITLYEAEDGTIADGAITNTTLGFSGTGYVSSGHTRGAT